jgi:iron complex outermembrane receptor protein
MNFGLSPARSKSVEAGIKARIAASSELTAAVFRTGTEDEIVTQTNVGGRSTFQNAGRTRRNGFELAWTGYYLENLRARVAYTALDARYRDAFATCSATPCTTPTQVIAAGSRIPGLAKSSLFAGLYWVPPRGWRGGVELRAVSKVVVNDANSDAAAGYAVASAYVGYLAQVGAWEFEGFARADNLAARKYAGSVIVNEGNARFFEPAPGRTWLAGASATVRF